MKNEAWGRVSYDKRVLGKNPWNSTEESKVYDEVFYENDRKDIAVAAPFVRRYFLRDLPGWDSCCDLGCGLGTWMTTLTADGKDVAGVDFSVGAQASNTLGDRYHHHDLTQPFDLGRTFDVVTCWEVFEHLPREMHAGFMDNVLRLDPKVLIMSCAGMRCIGADTGELDPVVQKQKGRHHYSCMPLKEFASIIVARGFQVDGVLSSVWRQVPRLPNHYRHNTLVFTRDRDDVRT